MNELEMDKLEMDEPKVVKLEVDKPESSRRLVFIEELVEKPDMGYCQCQLEDFLYQSLDRSHRHHHRVKSQV